ncbi:MADS-box transcription factor 22-like [Wolffia australiana]
MAGEKHKIKRIENPTSRQVTFSKRRRSLFKKAQELAVLCDVSVGLVVLSESRRLYEFSSSSSMKDIIDKYNEHPKNVEKHSEAAIDVTGLEPTIDEESNLTSNLRGDSPDELTSTDLARGEGRLQSGLRREQNLKEQISKLLTKVSKSDKLELDRPDVQPKTFSDVFNFSTVQIFQFGIFELTNAKEDRDHGQKILLTLADEEPDGGKQEAEGGGEGLSCIVFSSTDSKEKSHSSLWQMAQMLTGGSGGQTEAKPNVPEDEGSFDVSLRLGYL